MHIESKLAAMGLTLPPPFDAPSDLVLPFAWARRHGNNIYLSGHGPIGVDGALVGPFGKVGAEVSPEEAYQSARLTALAMIASLKREIRELDRVQAWLHVFGMVNVAPGFTAMPAVMNGFSDLILEVFGPDLGKHARSAVGVSSLPFNIPVEIEAEVSVGYHF